MSVASPMRALPREETRKRVLTRLLEKHDPAKTKHKPLSILRLEIRRSAEQLLEQETGGELEDAEALLEDVLSEIPCMNPLEDLFRDEGIQEFLIVAPQLVIRRSGDSWLPTSVQFRDNDHCRAVIKKFLQTAEPIGDVPKTSDGAADAKLANGFRLITILPPRVLEMSPMAVFRRPIPPTVSDATPPPRSEAVSHTPRVPIGSGVSAGSLTGRAVDPWERTKQRITELFVQRLAANGVFDISALPLAELRRVIGSYVMEFNETEKMHLDAAAQDRLTLEILTGMNR